jgi:hypothetical protein
MRILIFIFVSFFILSCSKSKEIKENNIVPETEKTINLSKGLLECKETTFYAGKVKAGQSVEHTFSFVNIGEEPVIILEKTMSCNCTDLKTSLDTIQPKETTNLKVKIDTKDKNLGKNNATVTVKTNGSRKFYLLEVNFDIVE